MFRTIGEYCLGGLYNIFLKKNDPKNFFSSQLWQKILKIQFLKNISCKVVFFIPNMILECFQLSFDIHIVHTSQKFRFFPNCSTKNWKIFFVRLIDFSSILQKSYGWLDVFQRLYRWIKMPAFIWDLFYFIWMKFGDIFAKCVILIPPHLIDCPKSPPWLGLTVQVLWSKII